MYVIVFGLILLSLSILEFKNKLNKKIEFLLLSLIFLFFILRYTLGTDIFEYQYFYKYININHLLYSQLLPRSALYTLIISFMSKYIDCYEIFILVLNLINTSLIMYTICKESRNKFFSIFILLTSGVSQVYMMSGIRQGLAMSFFFFGYFNFLKKKKYFPYIIFSILSAMCHEAGYLSFAILMLTLISEKYPVLFNKKLNLTFLIIATIIGLFGKNIFLLFGKLIDNSNLFFRVYLRSWNISYSGLALRVLLMIVIGTLYYFVDDSKKLKYKTSIYIYFIFTLFYICLCGISMVSRVNDYYAIIELILIPDMLLDKKPILKKQEKYIFFMTLILYILINFTMLTADILHVVNWMFTERFYYAIEKRSEIRGFSDWFIQEMNFFTYPYIPIFGFLFK